MIQITEKELDKTKDKEWTIVYLYADWCKVCQGFSPIVEHYSNEFPQHQWLKINAPENQEYSKEIDFENLPYFALYHLGNFIGGEVISTEEQLNGLMNLIENFKQR